MRAPTLIFCFVFVVAAIFVAPPRSFAGKESLPEGWRKMHVGHVSFYVPPHLRRTGLPGNRGVVAAFSGRYSEPYFYYAYGPHVPCAESHKPSDQRTDIVIDRKKAQIEFVVLSTDEMLASTKSRHTLTLCVPDVGDGKNKFEIYAVSLDVTVLNTFKQSFDHIRFR
jgi:hypothetical protein